MKILRLAVIVLVSAAVAVVGAYVVWSSLPDNPAGDEGTGGVDVAQQSATEVLGEWDRRRAAAWAEGDVRALASLYTTGSGAGDSDVGMLREYADRGLVVEGLNTQLLKVEQVRRSPDTLVVRVTDRVEAGVVVGEGVRQQLPRDLPTTRVVEFRLVERGWVVSGARAPEGKRTVQDRAPASPAASTSWTSASSKS